MKNKIKIIAEVAQGYEGDKKIADLLLKGAIKTGADIVKFQLIYADEISSKKYEYFKFFKSLEMDYSVWFSLVKKAKKHKIKFYFDIFGKKSLKIAKKLKVDGVKITTTDFYNYNLIEEALNNFKTVILSVAGCSILDIQNHLSKIKKKNNIVLMYGFQSEPTKISDNNILRLNVLKNNFKNNSIGFMDHTDGSSKYAKYIPFASLSTGISYLEKHITLDYNLKLEDSVSALSIDKFHEFVEEFREVEKSLGKNKIIISKKEKIYKNIAAKNVILNKNLKKNTKLKLEHLSLIRVVNDKKNSFVKNPEILINKILNKSLKKNSPIKLKDIN